MLNTACTSSMLNTMLPVIQIDGTGRPDEGVATRFGMGGMELEAHAVPSGRYEWLEFQIPESGHRVKALGEVVSVVCSQGQIRVHVQFKHVFPADRLAMSGFLQAHAVAA